MRSVKVLPTLRDGYKVTNYKCLLIKCSKNKIQNTDVRKYGDPEGTCAKTMKYFCLLSCVHVISAPKKGNGLYLKSL